MDSKEPLHKSRLETCVVLIFGRFRATDRSDAREMHPGLTCRLCEEVCKCRFDAYWNMDIIYYSASVGPVR